MGNMGKPKVRAVLFDVDGVLINSDEALHKVFNHTLEEFGFPPRSHKQALAPAGLSGFEWIRAIIPPSARGNAKLIREMDSHAARIYSTVGIQKWIRPLKGTAQALRALRAAGLKLAVITNMERAEMNAMLNRFGWGKYFSAKVCISDVRRGKPSPEPLLLAVKRLGTSPAEALYAGDTQTDVEATSAAKIRVVILAHARNRKVKGDYRIISMRRLPALVKRLSQ